jgi:hypothetical protein
VAAGRDVREINREVQEWIEATVAALHGDRGGGETGLTQRPA